MAIPTLTLGAMNLTDWAGTAYRTAVMASGISKGAPTPINVTIDSFLQDGAVVVTQGYDNREVTLRVQFRGTNLTAVSQAEAALFGELGKPNLLTWTPASGPASVFVVVTSSMEEAPGEDGDLAEAQPFPWRYYNVRLTCEAFTRSATETVTPALPTTGATTNNVDTMGATTGWTGSLNGVGATVTNAVGPPTTNSVTQSATYGAVTVAMQKTISLTTSALKYLVVDWKRSTSGNPGPLYISSPFEAVGDGVTLGRMAEVASPTAGFTRTTFYVAAASIGVLKLQWAFSQATGAFPAVARTLTLDNIAISDVRPVIGNARQQIRSLDVTGSARTQGSLAIESATVSLGDTIVYVYPDAENTDGYIPALRSYRTAGNTVSTNSSLCSGASESITTPGVTYQVPVANLPASGATLMARLLCTAGTTITWTAKTTLGGVDSNTVTGTFTVPSNPGSYRNYALARVQLPTTDLDPASPAVVTINILASSTCSIDEAWIFSNIGALVMVNCGTATAAVGGPAKRLFIEPATITTPRMTVRMGHSADRSDAYFPSPTPVSWQTPIFQAGTVNIFTCTAQATDTTVALRHFPRWFTNPAA